jgi:hypothetical protein
MRFVYRCGADGMTVNDPDKLQALIAGESSGGSPASRKTAPSIKNKTERETEDESDSD